MSGEFEGPERVLDGEDLAEAAEGEPLGDRKLFSNDHGRLPLEVRIVLARLLRGPYLDSSNSAHWTALAVYEPAIRQWLGEVFLELVVNREDGVAFIRQIRPPELPEKAPVLLRPSRLTYLEAVLLLILRARHMSAEAMGERAVISLGREEIISLLNIHKKKDETNFAAVDLHVNAVIKRFVHDYKILKKLQGSSERYEISPVIRFIATPELIRDLAAEFESILSKTPDPFNEVFGGQDAFIDSRSSDGPLPGKAGEGPSGPLKDPLTGGDMPDHISSKPLVIDEDEEEGEEREERARRERKAGRESKERKAGRESKEGKVRSGNYVVEYLGGATPPNDDDEGSEDGQ
jgi:hypothetical protein